MRQIEEIIKQQPVYLNNWKNKYGVLKDFNDVYLDEEDFLATECPFNNTQTWIERKSEMQQVLDNYKDVNILFASYGTDNWSGDAFVLFEKESALYEVNGSHCSCYGLEGQWEPEEVLLEEMKNRLTNGRLGIDDWSDNNFNTELKSFLGIE